MPQRPKFRTHRTWEDYLGLGLGVATGLSPWFREEFLSGRVYTNAAVVGLLVFMLAQFEFIRTRRGEELGELACGLWLLASPFVFGYAMQSQLRIWHWGLGAAIVALAAFEYWQGGDLAIEDRD